MSADIIRFCDYQNKRDIQRLYEEVTAELMAISVPVEIENVELVDTSPAEYKTPETDPA